MTGDLIVGEPFRCLDEMRYHPWVKLIFMYTKGIAISTAIIRFPFANTLIQLMTQYPVHRDMEAHHDFTVAQVAERMAHKNPRPDFIEPMIRAHEENEVTMTEIHANAHNLIVGGSEKTATRLSDVTYLLATHRDNLQKVYEELKATFKHEDEIKVVSLNKLEYMFAVLHKGLRISPAVPGMIPRKTPPEGIQIGRDSLKRCWIFESGRGWEARTRFQRSDKIDFPFDQTLTPEAVLKSEHTILAFTITKSINPEKTSETHQNIIANIKRQRSSMMVAIEGNKYLKAIKSLRNASQNSHPTLFHRDRR
ncbi:hypothetical protein BM1_00769 [Bipolaris maydis]|nr:hypothetical protein BM1_00769 [Bipolaris maydis]